MHFVVHTYICNIYIIVQIYFESRFVTRWLEQQRSQIMNTEGLIFSQADVDAHLDELVRATITHIRFSMMTPRQLAELLLNPFTQIYKEFLVERMAIGMSFHSGIHFTFNFLITHMKVLISVHL